MVRRGEIYFADLDPVIGSEQGGTRPVLIVQNDMGNKNSPTVIAICVTSRMGKRPLPTHVRLNKSECGLERESIVLCEQVRTLEKTRLLSRVGEVTPEAMARVEKAMCISIGIHEKHKIKQVKEN